MKKLKLRESSLPKFMHLIEWLSQHLILNLSKAEVKLYGFSTILHLLPKKIMASWIYNVVFSPQIIQDSF